MRFGILHGGNALFRLASSRTRGGGRRGESDGEGDTDTHKAQHTIWQQIKRREKKEGFGLVTGHKNRLSYDHRSNGERFHVQKRSFAPRNCNKLGEDIYRCKYSAVRATRRTRFLPD